MRLLFIFGDPSAAELVVVGVTLVAFFVTLAIVEVSSVKPWSRREIRDWLLGVFIAAGIGAALEAAFLCRFPGGHSWRSLPSPRRLPAHGGSRHRSSVRTTDPAEIADARTS
ncbi:MAG: hypothetical protein ACR2NA_06645, partial [Solirubrobacterales bacterium]